MGATGLLAGGAAVAVSDVAGKTPAAASTTSTSTPDWVSVVSKGADPTGASDSAAAFTSAISEVQGNGGGVVYVPAGTYKIESTVTCATPSSGYAPVYFVGDGAYASIVSYYGTGDCFRVVDNSTYSGRTKFGGGFIGITIDGSNAGTSAASTGLHVGDILQYELDLSVQNFTASGSIGVHLDNNYYWTEQLYGRIHAQRCASHVVFDWTSSASTTSSGSFERCDLDIYIDQQHTAFDGVVFQNGAYVTNGSLKIRGNFGYSSSTVSSAVLRLAGYKNNVNGYTSGGGITDSMLDIGVECSFPASGTYYTPQTIAFESSENVISGCFGLLNFGAAGNIFAESNNNRNVYDFMGQIGGDPTLPGQWKTYSTGLPSGVTGHVAFRAVPTGHEIMVSWSFAIASGTKLTAGESIVTIDSRLAYGDNKVIPGNNTGGGLSGNVYAPGAVAPGGIFKYAGPTYTSSGTSWWYGQGIYTLSL
jgi:hypothetical protein